jgi:putative Holliday junction resolvase
VKRVGLAVSDDTQRFSFERGAVLNDGKLPENIYKLLKEENAGKIVVGYPLNLKSEKTLQTLEVDKFIERLQSFFLSKNEDVTIEIFDERFTSKMASGYIANSSMKKSKRQDKSMIDSISAQIILQDYLDKNINIRNQNQEG